MMDVCNDFGLAVDVSKVGSDPMQFKTSATLYDLAANISKEVLDTTNSILRDSLASIQAIQMLMTQFSAAIGGNVPLYGLAFANGSLSPSASQSRSAPNFNFSDGNNHNFNSGGHIFPNAFGSSVRSSINSSLDHNRYDGLLSSSSSSSASLPTSTARQKQMLDFTADVADIFLGDSSGGRRRSGSAPATSPTAGTASSPSASTTGRIGVALDGSSEESVTTMGARRIGPLTGKLTDSLLECLGQVKSMESALFIASTRVAEAMDAAAAVNLEMEDIITRTRTVAMLTSCHSPSYCGWVRRSAGYSRADKSLSGRCWAVLVQGNLVFMQQPYSTSVSMV